MSDIDDVLAYFDPGPRARECGDGERADTHDRARLELAQLRRAVEEMRRGVERHRPDKGSPTSSCCCSNCAPARTILAEIGGKEPTDGK